MQDTGKEDVEVSVSSDGLKPFEIITLPYPGFPTDLQAQACALACTIPGLSILTERIYPSRFMHVPELLRMGADVSLEGSNAIVHGGKRLNGAPVMASDLRASAALILAGLVADEKLGSIVFITWTEDMNLWIKNLEHWGQTSNDYPNLPCPQLFEALQIPLHNL